jgi:oligopeptide transport system permease protein
MASGVVTPDEFTGAYQLPDRASLWGDAWRRIRRNRLALLGAVIIGVLVVTAVVSAFWTPYSTSTQSLGRTYSGLSAQHPFGLDAAGRDVLSRIMGGAAITVEVGLLSALIISLVGITLGLLAGFYRGWFDTVISFLINIWYGIPDLLVAMILVFVLSQALHVLPRGLPSIVLAYSLTRWMDMARLVRGQTLSIREREFIEAARATGTRNFGILVRHILPNALGPILVQATFAVPGAILFEAFLSFLGLGLPAPTPSWGAMASDGYHAMEIAAHIVIAPTIALSLTLMAFNWLGDGLRDAIDPRMKR